MRAKMLADRKRLQEAKLQQQIQGYNEPRIRHMVIRDIKKRMNRQVSSSSDTVTERVESSDSEEERNQAKEAQQITDTLTRTRIKGKVATRLDSLMVSSNTDNLRHSMRENKFVIFPDSQFEPWDHQPYFTIFEGSRMQQQKSVKVFSRRCPQSTKSIFVGSPVRLEQDGGIMTQRQLRKMRIDCSKNNKVEIE